MDLNFEGFSMKRQNHFFIQKIDHRQIPEFSELIDDKELSELIKKNGELNQNF